MKPLVNFWSSRSRRGKLAIIAAVLVGAFGVLLYSWLFADLPPISALNDGLALPSTRIYDRNAKLLYEILPPEQGRNTVVALDDIPQTCRDAAIATEDANFYSHPGIDLVAIVRAVWINLQGGEVLVGGSTITQQVARTLLFDPQQRLERTAQRKLKEMILALRLQAAYSKDEVLALYLNQVYFGNLAYGIEAAARAYFGKSSADLSLAECALLIGMVQNPSAYDPLTNLESAIKRQEVVLGLMVDQGKITQTQADLAMTDELQFAATRFPIEAPHFVMTVWTQLERLYPEALYRDGLDVITTLDLDWQNVAQSIVQRQLNLLNTRPTPANANNAAVIALDPFNGQVLTMLGSPDYFNARIDGAVNAVLALRQPGSVLKPFTYAAAMNPTRAEPWTAATLVMDVETPFVTRKLESYIPGNYGLREHGPVLVREALASSYNIPAVIALEAVGIEKMVELSANAGLETLLTNTTLDLSVTLGGGEVRLLDMAQAYSIFPNGGYRIEPHFLLSVKIRETGELLYQWQPPKLETRVLDARVAFLISDILSDSTARSREFGKVSALDLGRPAAAKTGTTTDYRDNWTLGYTPNLVVGVWVGNANNLPMVDVTGVSGAAPIWNDFMRRVLTGQPELGFTRPEGLERVTICALSGMLPTAACPLTREEWFITGTAPTQPDTLYRLIEIDSVTGRVADANTPPERRVQQSFVILPPEAREWGRRNGMFVPAGYDDFTTIISTTNTSAAFRILTPAPYRIFQVTTALPAGQQRIRLSVVPPNGTRQVHYSLNGEVIATVEAAPYDAWWTLAIGEYRLAATATLVDGTQQTTEPIIFSVVEETEPQSRNVP